MVKIKFPETDVIGCRFPISSGKRNEEVRVDKSSKEYFYKLLPGQPKPSIGDLVVVACVNGFKVCVVTTLDAMAAFENMAYVVGVVDITAYRDTLRRQELREHLYAQLMQKKKDLEELITLDLLAEKSPEFKELLEKYRSL